MSESTSTLPSADTGAVAADRRSPLRRQRAMVLLILALCAAPIVLGTLAFYFFPPHGRTNYGQLIQPHPFVLAARLDDGTALAPPALADRWWLVTVAAGTCEAQCARSLLLMRQLRLAQGKDQDRLGRLLVLEDPRALRDIPPALTSGLRTAVLADGGAGSLAAPASPFDGEDPTAHLYLVDPFGNLMMSFPSDGDPRRMLRDIEHLLQVNSWERVGQP